MKTLGFKFATESGVSFPITDLKVPAAKDGMIQKVEKQVAKIEKLYLDGAITNGERRNKVISLWGNVFADVAQEMYEQFEQDDTNVSENKDGNFTPFNPIFMSIDSGARGSREQIRQLVGMRGLMSNHLVKLWKFLLRVTLKKV